MDAATIIGIAAGVGALMSALGSGIRWLWSRGKDAGVSMATVSAKLDAIDGKVDNINGTVAELKTRLNNHSERIRSIEIGCARAHGTHAPQVGRITEDPV